MKSLAASCGICGDVLQSKTSVCSVCSTPYHEACWDYNGGCAVYGCQAATSATRPPDLEFQLLLRQLLPFLAYPALGVLILCSTYAVMLLRAPETEKTTAVAAAAFPGHDSTPEVEASVERLIDVLRSGNAPQQEGATAALGALGSAAHRAVPDLVKILERGDRRGKEGAARALGQIGSAARAGVPGLIHALDEEDARVRWRAAWALARMEGEAIVAIPHLIRSLTDLAALVRGQAALSLDRIVPRASSGDPRLDVAAVKAQQTQLRAALINPHYTIRKTAASLLGLFLGADAVPDLVTTLKDESSTVRGEAARALGRIGPAASGAVPALTVLLQDPVGFVRASAQNALKDIGPG